MNVVRKILSKMANAFELPADVLAGVPRIELTGFSECSIEPHKGLSEYGEKEIIVDSCLGQIWICGENLFVKRMNHRSISIGGMIGSVTRKEDTCHE